MIIYLKEKPQGLWPSSPGRSLYGSIRCMGRAHPAWPADGNSRRTDRPPPRVGETNELLGLHFNRCPCLGYR